MVRLEVLERHGGIFKCGGGGGSGDATRQPKKIWLGSLYKIEEDVFPSAYLQKYIYIHTYPANV